MKWALHLEPFGYTFTQLDDSLIEPNFSRPTQLCRDLARDLKLGQTKAGVRLKK
jgi:hypothetical protein